MSSGQKNSYVDEALLEQAAIPPAAECNHGAGFSWLTIIGFAFLTFNSAMAVYQGNGDWGAVFFVGSSFLTLVLLFHCLRWYAAEVPGSPRREDLKMAAWLLTMMLTVAAFMLLEFWFSNMGDMAAKGRTAPQMIAGPPDSAIGYS